MINNEFYSDLKEVIEDYLEEMKATGFSTEVPRRYLQHLDAFYAAEWLHWKTTYKGHGLKLLYTVLIMRRMEQI